MQYIDPSRFEDFLPVESQDGELFVVYDYEGVAYIANWDAETEAFYDNEDQLGDPLIVDWWFKLPSVVSMEINYGKEP